MVEEAIQRNRRVLGRNIAVNYWIVTLARPDLEHCLKVGVFGLSRKNIISSVRKGDKVACCAGKGDWKFIALGEATSDYYVDDEPVFLKDGQFLDRFNFSAKKCREQSLIELLDQLSFVSNPAFWAVYFRNGITKIDEHDWRLIGDLVLKQ